MANTITLPMLGQTMEEGTIIRWMKNEGDTVEKGEPLYEVMTDKVNMEVEAPESGVLRKILAQPDETVPIFADVAIIGTADEPIDDLLESPAAPEAPAAAEAAPAQVEKVAPSEPVAEQIESSRVFISPRARALANEHGIDIQALAGRGTGSNGRVVESDVQAYIDETSVKATPLAAKMAISEGLDLSRLVGSGIAGKIRSEDVTAALQAKSETGYRTIPFAGMRKQIADNVSKSIRTAPHVTLTLEVDMSEAVRLRQQVGGEFEKKYGVKLTYTDLIVKSAALALVKHPVVNSSLQGDEIRLYDKANVGIAVALEGGLVVPVVKSADSKAVSEIAVESRAIVDRARNGRFTSDDISGGTFTITNLGAYGIDVFNPIIATGQTAILGVCRIADKPVVANGQVVVRPMMNLCLSFDHRVIDGAPAASFLQDVKKLLESPAMLLI